MYNCICNLVVKGKIKVKQTHSKRKMKKEEKIKQCLTVTSIHTRLYNNVQLTVVFLPG